MIACFCNGVRWWADDGQLFLKRFAGGPMVARYFNGVSLVNRHFNWVT